MYIEIWKTLKKKQFHDLTRGSICRKYDNDKSPFIIARELELNSKTVTSVIQLYKKCGRIKAKKAAKN